VLPGVSLATMLGGAIMIGGAATAIYQLHLVRATSRSHAGRDD